MLKVALMLAMVLGVFPTASYSVDSMGDIIGPWCPVNTRGIIIGPWMPTKGMRY